MKPSPRNVQIRTQTVGGRDARGKQNQPSALLSSPLLIPHVPGINGHDDTNQPLSSASYG